MKTTALLFACLIAGTVLAGGRTHRDLVRNAGGDQCYILYDFAGGPAGHNWGQFRDGNGGNTELDTLRCSPAYNSAGYWTFDGEGCLVWNDEFGFDEQFYENYFVATNGSPMIAMKGPYFTLIGRAFTRSLMNPGYVLASSCGQIATYFQRFNDGRWFLTQYGWGTDITRTQYVENVTIPYAASPTGTWETIAYTHDLTLATGYRNGVWVTNKTAGTGGARTTNASGYIAIGASTLGAYYGYDGDIATVGVWLRQMDAAEVKEVHNWLDGNRSY